MKRKGIWVAAGVVTFLFVGVYIFMVVFINPIVIGYSYAKIEPMTGKGVNRAISNVVGADVYPKLTDIRYDSSGKIVSLTTNTLQINGISSDIALASQSYLELFATQGIAVPIGTFSGLPILTGKGPNANLRVVPVGSINCGFTSEFLSAGINQTRHRIVLKVRSIVSLVMPLAQKNVEAEIEVLLCESIIIGEVPEFFFQKN